MQEISINLAIAFLIVAFINLITGILEKTIKCQKTLLKVKIIYPFLPFFISFLIFFILKFFKLHFFTIQDAIITAVTSITAYDVIVKNYLRIEAIIKKDEFCKKCGDEGDLDDCK